LTRPNALLLIVDDPWSITMAYGRIQCISGSFLGTGGVADFGCPTIMGATGAYLGGRLNAAFPSGVPSQVWANPIQHVPNPAAWAANIKFSAAKAQFSIAHGLSPTDEMTMSAGA
jgi:hypothetical protein